jgi:hypothetical protein
LTAAGKQLAESKILRCIRKIDDMKKSFDNRRESWWLPAGRTRGDVS